MSDPPPDAIRPESTRLLLDVMLGRLVPYLRVCGYDAAYAGDRDVEADDRLLELVESEDRVLVTRDVQLVERTEDGICLTAREVDGQLSELRAAGLRLEPEVEPSRCGRCNGLLEAVPTGESTPEYAPDPTDTECWRCSACGQVFWKGSHWDRMVEVLD